MSKHYSDPTANMAVGSVDRELKRMKELAKKLDKLKKEGRLTPEDEENARRLFIGIYKNLF